jgi:hypothetical protein
VHIEPLALLQSAIATATATASATATATASATATATTSGYGSGSGCGSVAEAIMRRGGVAPKWVVAELVQRAARSEEAAYRGCVWLWLGGCGCGSVAVDQWLWLWISGCGYGSVAVAQW